MKRIFILFFLLLFTFPLLAQESKPYKLYVFGSEYSGQTVAFQRDAESDSKLKQRLSELNCRYLNADEPDASESDYRYLTLKEARDYPFFVITDPDGDVYMVRGGYHSAARFLEDFGNENLASKSLMYRLSDLNERNYRKLMRNKNIPFSVRLAYSPWSMGVEGGVSFSNLAESGSYTDYHTGYYGSFLVKYYVKNRSYLESGLSFNSLGGNGSGEHGDIRLNYLTLPVKFHKRIRKLGYLYLNGGIYGSYLLADKIPAGGPAKFKDWDAGVKVGLNWDQGSFRLNAGYTRGFVDLLPGQDKAFTNAFQIGLAIVLGD